MTRDEAIEILKEHIDTYVVCHGEEDMVAVSLDNVDVEALSKAIEALKKDSIPIDYIRQYAKEYKNPSNNPSEDLIEDWECEGDE